MILYKNVLSQDLLADCLKEFEYNKTQKCWALSTLIWPSEILEGVAGACAISDVNEGLQERIKSELSMVSSIFFTHRIFCQYYMWNPYSAISSHNDGVYPFGATIYLNKNWNINHGGVFLWEENGKNYAKVPEFNSMMINNSRQQHLVTAVSPFAPEARMTIQIWGYDD